MPARNISELPPAAWSKNTGYAIDLNPLPFRVRAMVAGETVLDSDRVRVMYELGHAPVYYVPSNDLCAEFLVANDHSTYCPYKGDASYWSLTVGEKRVENAIWGYLDPYPEMAELVTLRGIYWDRMDAWFHDGTEIDEPLEIPGRVNEQNNFAACHPALAKEWHRERNEGIRPYEFASDDVTPLWWINADGEEWQSSIKERVQRGSRAS